MLLEDTLDIEITECGRLELRQRSATGPAIEFLNRGTATEETNNGYAKHTSAGVILNDCEMK